MHDGGWGLWVIHSTNEIEKTLGNLRQVGENDVSWFTLSRALLEYPLSDLVHLFKPSPQSISPSRFKSPGMGTRYRMADLNSNDRDLLSAGVSLWERGSKPALMPGIKSIRDQYGKP